jgi:putative transposase
MIACQELSTEVGTAAACQSLDIARPTYYRRLGARIEEMPAARRAPPRALSALQRQEVLDVLHTDRFVDKAPTEVYATLLDEGSTIVRFGPCTAFWTKPANPRAP